VIHLQWRIERERPVVIGAGRYTTVGGEAPSDLRTRYGARRPAPAPKPVQVVTEVVRRGPAEVPVLPGSSLKGAVRQAYELLTPSCFLIKDEACKVPKDDDRPEICPACSLFGAAGLGGRLSFGEAQPVVAEWRPQLIVLKDVPLGWRPQKWLDGTLGVYDQRGRTPLEDPQARLNRRTEPAARETTYAVWGMFQSRIRLINASEEELGLLFAAFGVWAPKRPMIRLGGKKYHGAGAADVLFPKAVRSHPVREVLTGQALVEWARELVERWVIQVPERHAAWTAYHEALGAG
jgi:hypothetical protein